MSNLKVLSFWFGVTMFLVAIISGFAKGIYISWDHALSLKDQLSFWPFYLAGFIGLTLIQIAFSEKRKK